MTSSLENIFGKKKSPKKLYQKNIWVNKILGPKNLVRNKCLVHNILWAQNNFVIKKYLGKKVIRPKKEILVAENFGSETIFSPTKIWGSKNLCGFDKILMRSDRRPKYSHI